MMMRDPFAIAKFLVILDVYCSALTNLFFKFLSLYFQQLSSLSSDIYLVMLATLKSWRCSRVTLQPFSTRSSCCCLKLQVQWNGKLPHFLCVSPISTLSVLGALTHVILIIISICDNFLPRDSLPDVRTVRLVVHRQYLLSEHKLWLS